MADARRRRGHLVDRLVAAGDLAPGWVEAFLNVPRHAFLPEVLWRHDGEFLRPLRRAEEPEAWLALAYANDAVATQVDDGEPAGPGGTGWEATSSASQPSVVAVMLAALRVEAGMSVCEIGTGTGWNAALLAHRLGPGRLVSIEVDGQLAERARDTLHHAKAEVCVVHGDGTAGYPERAPYDRVIATAAVYDIPYAWVAQTRPGGLVLTPWRTEFHPGELLLLQVGPDGCARGNVIGTVSFMTVRAQRTPRGGFGDTSGDTADRTSTDLHPHSVTHDRHASFAVGLAVPHCQHTARHDPRTGAAVTWLLDPRTRSWAAVAADDKDDNYGDNSGATVHQHGPRRLWDEVYAAYTAWRDSGAPPASSWQVTVTSTGQHITR